MMFTSVLGSFAWVPVMDDLSTSLKSVGFRYVEPSTAPDTGTILVLAGRPGLFTEFASMCPSTVDIVPLVWDIWPVNVEDWADALAACGPRRVVVMNEWPVTALSSFMPGVHIKYMAQGVDVDTYWSTRPLSERPVGVLEYGRRDEWYHEEITEALGAERVKHVYLDERKEIESHHVLFETREELVVGLQSAAVSVCFPASLTHPWHRTQGVEGLSARYLESIAAGCLVLGNAPAELLEVFGYNPVIEVDWLDPIGQVLSVTSNLSAWSGHVRHAQEQLRLVGDWAHTAARLRDFLARVS